MVFWHGEFVKEKILTSDKVSAKEIVIIECGCYIKTELFNSVTCLLFRQFDFGH